MPSSRQDGGSTHPTRTFGFFHTPMDSHSCATQPGNVLPLVVFKLRLNVQGSAFELMELLSRGPYPFGLKSSRFAHDYVGTNEFVRVFFVSFWASSVGFEINDAEETVWLLGKDEKSKSLRQSPSSTKDIHEEQGEWPERLPGDGDPAKSPHGSPCTRSPIGSRKD